MHAQYLEVVKTLIQSSPKFSNCRVSIYIEPSISSAIFYINADGYKHIFKAPFGLLESNLTATALAEIIIDEVKEWGGKVKWSLKNCLQTLTVMHIWILYQKKGQWLYEGKVIFITSDLHERTIKLVDIIRNEFFITTED